MSITKHSFVFNILILENNIGFTTRLEVYFIKIKITNYKAKVSLQRIFYYICKYEKVFCRYLI